MLEGGLIYGEWGKLVIIYISRFVGNINDADLRNKKQIIHFSETMLTCSSSIIGFGGSEPRLSNLSH
jgi:hypothetical protein